MRDTWERRIENLVDIKSDFRTLQHTLGAPATEEQIAEVERHLGYPLDAGYREFLTHANGWKGFYRDTDLFGTAELLGSPMMEDALAQLAKLDDWVLAESGFSRDELVPIAFGPSAKKVHVVSHAKSHAPGVFIYFHHSYDGLIFVTFNSFDDYFEDVYYWNVSDGFDGVH